MTLNFTYASKSFKGEGEEGGRKGQEAWLGKNLRTVWEAWLSGFCSWLL